jgi:hypothetical protein
VAPSTATSSSARCPCVPVVVVLDGPVGCSLGASNGSL